MKINSWVVLLLSFSGGLGSFLEAKQIQKLEGKIISQTAILDLGSKEQVVVKPGDREARILVGKLSPDGKQIAFEYDPGDSQIPRELQLRTIDVNTKAEKTLLLDHLGFDFNWSPDSKFVVARGFDSELDFLAINVETKHAWRMKFPKEISKGTTHPYWCRDGEKMIFSAILQESEHKYGYFKAKLDGSDFQVLFATTSELEWITLSPKATKVGFVGNEDEALYTLDLNSMKTTKISNQLTNYDSLIPVPNFFASLFFSSDEQWLGAVLKSNTTSVPDTYPVWNLTSGERRDLPIRETMTNVQWWAPTSDPAIDCEPIVTSLLKGREVNLP